MRWLSTALKFAPKVYEVVADIVDNVRRRRKDRAAAERAERDASVLDELRRVEQSAKAGAAAFARKAADDARERAIKDAWDKANGK
jgi:hypothetical protein